MKQFCFWYPIIIFFLTTSEAKVNIGLRHILPVYSVLFVLAGWLATVSISRSMLSHSLIGIALSLTAVSSLHIAPHQLAYFNEFVGGPTIILAIRTSVGAKT